MSDNQFVKVDQLFQMLKSQPEEGYKLVCYTDNSTQKINAFKKINVRVLQIKLVNKEQKVIESHNLVLKKYIISVKFLSEEPFDKIVFDYKISEFQGKKFHQSKIYECNKQEIQQLKELKKIQVESKFEMKDDEELQYKEDF